MSEGIFERLGRAHARRFDLREDRRFFHLKPDIQRDHHQEDRNQEGDSPAVTLEIRGRHIELQEHDRDDRQKQA